MTHPSAQPTPTAPRWKHQSNNRSSLGRRDDGSYASAAVAPIAASNTSAAGSALLSSASGLARGRWRRGSAECPASQTAARAIQTSPAEQMPETAVVGTYDFGPFPGPASRLQRHKSGAVGGGQNVDLARPAVVRTDGLAHIILRMLIMGKSNGDLAVRGVEKGALSETGRTFFVPFSLPADFSSLLGKFRPWCCGVASGSPSRGVLDLRHAPFSGNRPGVPRCDCLDGHHPDHADCSRQSTAPAASRCHTRSPECKDPKLR